MIALLAHLHSDRFDYPVPPIYQYGRMLMEYWQGWNSGTGSAGSTACAAAKCKL